MPRVDQLIVIVAQYAIYAVAVGAVIAWLLVSRPEKYTLAAQAIVTVIVVAILVKVAGAVHTDPRPFVEDPSLKPLFPHPADNGFPSDHTAVGAVTSFVVVRHRRAAGLGLLAITVLIAAARVIAHVHHVQDVVAGGLIGLVAAIAGFLVWHIVRDTSLARRTTGRHVPAETASRGSSRSQ